MSDHLPDYLTLTIPQQHAWELAQLVKRITFAHFLELSVDKDEAYEMRDAVDALRRSLADAGFAPR